MPKLLFLVTEDWYFVSHRLPLAIAARSAGFDVAVATRVGDKVALIREAGIRVIPVEMDRSSMNPLKEARTVARLTLMMRREKPDLLHMVALKPVMLGSLAARLAGVPYVIAAVAGMGFLFTGEGRGRGIVPLLRRLLAMSLRQARVIVQNPEDAGLLAELGVPRGNLRLIRGVGVDIEHFRCRPEPAGPPVVMLPARLLWDKGAGEFVAAAHILRDAGVKARFVLVGEPDPANPASVPQKDIARWKEEGVVELWGRREDMPEVLARAHLVCLPSYREGLPKVVLESMACGRPVVTTDAPGCREAVRHGDNGLLVPVKDAVALAEAIRRLLEDPGLRGHMGQRGRKRAVKEFSQELVVGETLALYQEFLAHR